MMVWWWWRAVVSFDGEKEGREEEEGIFST